MLISKMAPVLYMTLLSPPSRAVLITAQALNIELELKHLDLSKGEHRSPEYLKINPSHSVPTLIDGDVTIVDSHAINAYLVRKYASDDSLYPKDHAKRALVDQRLHFDTGILFNHFRTIAGEIFYKKAKQVPQDQKDKVLETYKLLEIFLESSQWIAGSDVTIADFNIFTSLTSLILLVPLDSSVFPKIDTWIKKFKNLPYAVVNEDGLKQLKDVFEKFLA